MSQVFLVLELFLLVVWNAPCQVDILKTKNKIIQDSSLSIPVFNVACFLNPLFNASE